MRGDSPALQPIAAVRFLISPAAGKRLFDKVKALIKTVAADDDIVR